MFENHFLIASQQKNENHFDVTSQTNYETHMTFTLRLTGVRLKYYTQHYVLQG